MTVSIRTRLLAGFVVIVAVVAVATFLLLDRTLGQGLVGDLDARLRAQARGVVIWLDSAGHPERLAPRLGAVVGARVTIIDAGGLVLGDSERQTDLGRPIGDAPEVATARRGRTGRAIRRLADGGPPSYLVAVPTNDGRVIRLAVPVAKLEATRTALRERLLLASAVGMVVALVLGLLVIRALARPLRAMTRAAERVARGDYDIGPPATSSDELGVLSRALVGLADEVKRQVGAITRERDLSLAVIGAMVEGVVVVDGRGATVLDNPAARMLLGEPGPAAELAVLLDRARAGEPGGGEVRVRERAVVVSARPLGHTGGAVAVLHDVTRLRALEDVRRQFLANAAHELRTPVTAIAGYAETLGDPRLDPATRAEFVATIARNADRIARLVADLLELERLEARPAATGDRAAVALAPVVADAVAAAAARPGASPIETTVGADVVVAGDRDGLDHVVQNLIDNAQLHGGPPVRVATHRLGERIRLTVTDAGPGIPAAHQAHIFDRFYRVDGGRRGPGSGLGLAIARSHALAMGGTLTVDSSPAGTTFTLELDAAGAR